MSDFGYDVEEFSRIGLHRGRNTTVTLARRSDEGVLVKQHRPRSDRRYDAERAVHREILPELGLPDAVRVPAVLHDDPRKEILVFDLVPGAVDLGDRYARTRRLPAATMRRVGAFVGALHERTLTDGAASGGRAATRAEEARQMPLFDHVDPETYAAMSDGERRLAAAIQRDGTMASRLSLLANTVEPCCRLHGDLRPENVLLRGGRAERPVLIDWELSRISDPAVDLGYFVGCLLDRCLSAVRATTIEQWRARAQARLDDLRPGLQAFWSSYAAAAGRIVRQRPMLALLALGHAASALIAQLVGRAQDSGIVTARDWLVMQRARDLLVDPLAAFPLLLEGQAR